MPQPDLLTFPFKLDPGATFTWTLTGNVVFVATATDNIDIALVNNNYIPSKVGRVIHTPVDYTTVSIRAAAGVTTPVTGVIVLGHGSFGDFTDPKLLNDILSSVNGQAAIFGDILAATQGARANTAAILAHLQAKLDATTQAIVDAIQTIQAGGSGPATMLPHPTYAALAAAITAASPTGILAQVVVSTAAPPALETWQLRAHAGAPLTPGDITRAPAGIVAPDDYHAAANNRAWHRV
jgi:hypothetical protein